MPVAPDLGGLTAHLRIETAVAQRAVSPLSLVTAPPGPRTQVLVQPLRGQPETGRPGTERGRRQAVLGRRRTALLDAILCRADRRDREAERRDRAAERRSNPDPLAWIEREWAGRDRDAAAADRADLVALLLELDPEAVR